MVNFHPCFLWLRRTRTLPPQHSRRWGSRIRSLRSVRDTQRDPFSSNKQKHQGAKDATQWQSTCLPEWDLGLLSANCKKAGGRGGDRGAGEDTPQALAQNHRAELSHGSASLLLCLTLSLLLWVSEKSSCAAQAGRRLADSGRWPWPPDSPAVTSSHTILLPALIAVLPKLLQILTCSRTREQLAQILKEKNKTFKKLFKQKYICFISHKEKYLSIQIIIITWYADSENTNFIL